jgi:hypothetical protein
MCEHAFYLSEPLRFELLVIPVRCELGLAQELTCKSLQLRLASRHARRP